MSFVPGNYDTDFPLSNDKALLAEDKTTGYTHHSQSVNNENQSVSSDISIDQEIILPSTPNTPTKPSTSVAPVVAAVSYSSATS